MVEREREGGKDVKEESLGKKSVILWEVKEQRKGENRRGKRKEGKKL